MRKWIMPVFCLLAGLIFCAPALAGSNPLSVAADGQGIAVYTASDGDRQAGVLYNGYEGELSLEPENGMHSLELGEFTVWVNQEKAQKNMPESRYDNWTEYEQAMPCGAWLAQVNRKNAPLYQTPGKKHLSAKHAPGTLVAVWGEFGDYYYVRDGSWVIDGFMPRDCLDRVDSLTYREAQSPGFGLISQKRTVYTDGQELFTSASATGYSDTVTCVTLHDGDQAEVIATMADWVQLSSGGFVETRFLDPAGDHSLSWAAVEADQLLDRLNVRAYARDGASVIAKLCAGMKVRLISHTDDWAYIYLTGPSGGVREFGCVQRKFLETGEDADRVKQGFTRVRLTQDVHGNAVSDMYRAVWPDGDTLKAGTEMTAVGVGGNYDVTDEYPDRFLMLLDDGRLVWIFDDGGIFEPVSALGISAKADSNVKMRARPDKSGKVIRTLGKGEKAEVLLRGEGWTMVRYKEKTGYVMSRYLRFP